VGIGIAAFFLAPQGRWKVAAGLAGAAWVLAGTLRFVWSRLRGNGARANGGRFTAEMLGMSLAHAGVAVFLVGALLVEGLATQRELALKPGDAVRVDDICFALRGVERQQGPNYVADRGTVEVLSYCSDRIGTLHPEKRSYAAGGQVMTEAAIDPGLLRDMYVALGEPLGDGAWAVRAHVKPFVRWIWAGALLMALGGFVTATDRRFRRKDIPMEASA
jgi:cytochrome c-type biogenesis protein CcmF